VINWRSGVVTALGREWAGALELTVSDGTRALAYPALVGRPTVGDRVLLNTTALDQKLGTGGYALVVALPDRPPAPSPATGSTPTGHIVKCRYSPLQATVLSADEQDSPWHETLRDADDIGAMPVVVADLHSALPAVLAGIYQSAKRRVCYVMTDGGALPAWFSRTISGLRDADWLAGVVTTGQAFGGDLEAVTLHSGLLAARLVLDADIAIVSQGPGNAGTGTRWGFSGVAAGEAVNAAAVLGGRPVASLRVSFADPRPRHQGISHHSLTAYGRVALAPADVVVPELPGSPGERVAAQAASIADRHRLVTVSVDGLEDALRASPVRLSTMGRSLDEDLSYFLSAAAAGRHAAALPLRAGRRRSCHRPGYVADPALTALYEKSLPLCPSSSRPQSRERGISGIRSRIRWTAVARQFIIYL
jgi:hypothetical protein